MWEATVLLVQPDKLSIYTPPPFDDGIVTGICELVKLFQNFSRKLAEPKRPQPSSDATSGPSEPCENCVNRRGYIEPRFLQLGGGGGDLAPNGFLPVAWRRCFAQYENAQRALNIVRSEKVSYSHN